MNTDRTSSMKTRLSLNCKMPLMMELLTHSTSSLFTLLMNSTPYSRDIRRDKVKTPYMLLLMLLLLIPLIGELRELLLLLRTKDNVDLAGLSQQLVVWKVSTLLLLPIWLVSLNNR